VFVEYRAEHVANFGSAIAMPPIARLNHKQYRYYEPWYNRRCGKMKRYKGIRAVGLKLYQHVPPIRVLLQNSTDRGILRRSPLEIFAVKMPNGRARELDRLN